MTDINLKTETPDTTLPTTGFLFGADSQAAASPSVFTVQSVATTLLGSTTLTGATITANAPVLDLAQTWNNAAVTFTGLKFNVASDTSAAASLLMDLQVGGTSRFSVLKSGAISLGVNIAAVTSPNILQLGGSTVSTDRVGVNAGGLIVGGAQTLGFSSGLYATPDLYLTRRAADNLRFGAADAAAPVAQTLSVQSVVAGTSNIAGANLTITGSQGTGTGAGGSIIFQVAPAALSSGTGQNALTTALTIDSNRRLDTPTGIINSTLTASGAPWLILDTATTFKFQVNGLDRAFLSQTLAPFANGMVLHVGAINLQTTSGTQTAGAFLTCESANTLALRNAANAQTFNVYNTFTSSTNFELFRIFAQSAAAVLIGTRKGSAGGTARALELQTDGTTRLTIAATTGNVTTTGSVTTEAPTGGTAAAWRLGTVASVTPTLQNRTIEVDIGGTIYYISAKTTND